MYGLKLNMPKISISIVIDKKYIEPAMVTIITLLKFQNFYRSLKLILIKNNDDSTQDLQEMMDVLSKFKNSFDKINFIEILIIENKFPSFTKLHFSNAILYKIFTPIITGIDDYILNVDAGNLFHKGFLEFSENLTKLTEEKKEFVLGAFLTSSRLEMPAEITKFANYYPSGSIFLFNNYKYKQNKIADKIIEFYNEKSVYLKYAEQEILCAILDDSEFYKFEGWDKIYLDDLSLYVGADYSSIDFDKLNNSIFYKNPGSIKPWKNWNLNPNKCIYLKYRNEISKFIDLNQYSFITKERQYISENLIPYKSANLIAYENELISR